MRPGAKAGPRRKTLRAYERHADAYLAHWDKKRYHVPPLLAELIALLPKGTPILDLGCGPGQDTRNLRQRGFGAVGLDGTPAFLSRARRRSGRLALVRADLGALPFRQRAFTAVWAAASLIHLPKKEVRRLLKRLKGIVNEEGWLAATFAHGKGSGFRNRGWIPGRYFSFWLKAEMARALKATGWRIVSLKTVSNRERKGRWLNLIARAR